MSTADSVPGSAPAPVCPACGAPPQPGAYCGACGYHLAGHHIGGRRGRLHSYAAAPHEHVLRLSVVSSLFPHLPHRSHAPFRAGLALLVAVLALLPALRLQAPMVAVSVVGFPLLFQLYLQECDIYDDLTRRVVIGVAALEALLGWGWTQLTAHPVAHAFGDRLSAGRNQEQIWTVGIGVPIGGALIMLAPIAVWRLRRGADIEGLDGFVLGSAAALGFTVAATVTRLAPQLQTGLIAHGRPVQGLLVEAGVQGITVPLTAACAGGLFGATLWVRRRPAVHPGRILTSPVLAVAVIVVLYAGLGLVDLWQPDEVALLGLHAVVCVLLLVGLRLGMHAVLLHEHHRPVAGPAALCQYCLNLVPQLPFCPQCGVAAGATPRSIRAQLRLGQSIERVDRTGSGDLP